MMERDCSSLHENLACAPQVHIGQVLSTVREALSTVALCNLHQPCQQPFKSVSDWVQVSVRLGHGQCEELCYEQCSCHTMSAVTWVRSRCSLV